MTVRHLNLRVMVVGGEYEGHTGSIIPRLINLEAGQKGAGQKGWMDYLIQLDGQELPVEVNARYLEEEMRDDDGKALEDGTRVRVRIGHVRADSVGTVISSLIETPGTYVVHLDKPTCRTTEWVISEEYLEVLPDECPACGRDDDGEELGRVQDLLRIEKEQSQRLVEQVRRLQDELREETEKRDIAHADAAGQVALREDVEREVVIQKRQLDIAEERYLVARDQISVEKERREATQRELDNLRRAVNRGKTVTLADIRRRALGLDEEGPSPTDFNVHTSEVEGRRLAEEAEKLENNFVSADGMVYGPAMELRNATEHDFEDISSEYWRTYRFADSRGENLEEVTIYQPMWLSVSESGAARILDANGISHYIPFGWIHLEWEARDGSPHFVK